MFCPPAAAAPVAVNSRPRGFSVESSGVSSRVEFRHCETTVIELALKEVVAAGMFPAKPAMTLEVELIPVFAVSIGVWILVGSGGDGDAVVGSGKTTDVVVRLGVALVVVVVDEVKVVVVVPDGKDDVAVVP